MLGSCPKVLVTNEGREYRASSVDHVSPRYSPHHPAQPLGPGAAPRLQAAADWVLALWSPRARSWRLDSGRGAAWRLWPPRFSPCLSLALGPWPCWGHRGPGAAGSFS